MRTMFLDHKFMDPVIDPSSLALAMETHHFLMGKSTTNGHFQVRKLISLPEGKMPSDSINTM